jgi:hypothetical protein
VKEEKPSRRDIDEITRQFSRRPIEVDKAKLGAAKVVNKINCTDMNFSVIVIDC